MKDDMIVVTCLRLSEKTRKKFKQIAKKEHRAFTNKMAQVLTDYAEGRIK